ncbi:MAG: hypothetical protein COX77_01720 [Candidatus Komeilibacteria bacterium CG_4_10_14_0_2_um_filter_37_10]|uniref:Uncharacterized protein n=1 Tax=Candidatus Komeilibacteria bacterium CG_4_10_14_0_2_um_filter_37_10 TaxID=1974470 RepID=A0A2M7VFH6_9BACT|nr:MAG: hypothetical protein COX77_01720 [Candidatus Komeilibacteria bacterium CG_4_10_14_0_2_um_filter_37_10]PJA92541.1 MAG: hypothetical protein CO133_02650 [Candidatus Komeilibacteria bacterium CG_4_9_14_3_um_filter_37_5]
MFFLSFVLVALGLFLKIYSNAMHGRRRVGQRNAPRISHIQNWVIQLHNLYPPLLPITIATVTLFVLMAGLIHGTFATGILIGGLSFLIGWLIPSIGSSTREKLMKNPWKLIVGLLVAVWFLIDPASFQQVVAPAIVVLAFYLVIKYFFKKLKIF